MQWSGVEGKEERQGKARAGRAGEAERAFCVLRAGTGTKDVGEEGRRGKFCSTIQRSSIRKVI